MLLGYAKWENFAKVVDKAITSCQTAGYDPKDHFLGVRKMVDLGSGAKREIDDIALTRYACYLIAQNGDPTKDQIAFAQTYFAVQTRKQEIIEKRLAEAERVSARKHLSRSEKELSGIIFDRLRDNESATLISSLFLLFGTFVWSRNHLAQVRLKDRVEMISHCLSLPKNSPPFRLRKSGVYGCPASWESEILFRVFYRFPDAVEVIFGVVPPVI